MQVAIPQPATPAQRPRADTNQSRTTGSGHQIDPLRRLDTRLDRALGSDLRLIYGVGMPMLLVIAGIIALALSPSYWLVGATLVVEIGCLGFVITKLMAMLDEPDASGESYARGESASEASRARGCEGCGHTGDHERCAHAQRPDDHAAQGRAGR